MRERRNMLSGDLLTTATPPRDVASPGAPPPPIAMRRIGRDTLVYAAGILINRAAAFVLLPIYTHYLSPADYAVIQLVQMTLDFIAILAGAKLAIGVFRYFHAAKTEEERRAVAGTSLLLICGAYAIVSLGVSVFAAPLSTLVFGDPSRASLIRLAAVGLVGQSLFIVPLALARASGRSFVFVAANTVLLLLQIALNLVLLVHYRLGPAAMFLSNAIASMVVGAVLTIQVIRRIGLPYSGVAARRLVRYGLPLVATQVATFISTFGDRYVLSQHTDLTTVGLYTLAYQFGFLLAMVGSMPVDLVWEPIRFSLAERSDRDFVLSRAFVYLNLLLITVALAITLFTDAVLRVMTAPAFFPAATLVPVILVAYILQSWTGMHDLGIHLRERTEYITMANWVAAVVAIIGYLVLIPRWLGLGAAVATVLAFAVRYVIVWRVSLKLFPVRYDWTPVVRLVGLAVGAALLGLSTARFGIATSLALRTALFGAYLLAAWSAGILTAGERGAVRMFITERLSRRHPRVVPVA